MTATKQTRSALPPDFKPGSSYKRDDGELMVEVSPGEFVREIVAIGLGILPTKGADHGKAKT